MEVTKAETLHMVSQGDVVIARGWIDFRCKDTNKSGKLQYAITYTVKDGKIISYDEMTDSGESGFLLCIGLSGLITNHLVAQFAPWGSTIWGLPRSYRRSHLHQMRRVLPYEHWRPFTATEEPLCII